MCSRTAATSTAARTTGSRFPPPGTHGVDAARIDLQDLLIQEQQGVERLVLRAGRHVPHDRQMAEELLDFGSAHVARVPFAVEEDEAA